MGYLDINLDNLGGGGGGSGGVTSLNGETGAVNLVAGTNISITPSGSNITIASTGGSGDVISVTGTSPIFSSGGLNPDISIQVANTTEDGYLSSTDFNTFNAKQDAGAYITSLTGDGTASGPGAAAFTLATISTPGTFPKIIFNAKGQVLGGVFLSSADIPNNTANTTGTAGNITATSNSTLTTLSSLSLPASQITGTLPVVNGGTGQSSFTDGQILIGETTGNTLVPATLTAGTGIAITNGGGTITVSTTGAGATPGGANQSIQFNNAGVFAGFGTWDGTTLTVPGAAIINNVQYTSNANNDVIINPTSNVNQNIRIGSGATSSAQSVAVGFQANASATGTAIGYQANGSSFGTAVGTLANANGGGVAIGQLANGTSDTVAIGFHAAAGTVAGNVAIGGASTGTQAARIIGFSNPTVQIGAGTAVLDGGLNFGTGPGGTTYGIFDRTGKFHGDGSLLTNLPNQIVIGHSVGSGIPNAVLYVDASGNLANDSIFVSDGAGNISGLSFTASGTPGFTGDGSGLTNLPVAPTPPGGTSGQIQFNNAGTFGGFAQFDGTNVDLLGININLSSNGAGTGGGTLNLNGGVINSTFALDSGFISDDGAGGLIFGSYNGAELQLGVSALDYFGSSDPFNMNASPFNMNTGGGSGGSSFNLDQATINFGTGGTLQDDTAGGINVGGNLKGTTFWFIDSNGTVSFANNQFTIDNSGNLTTGGSITLGFNTPDAPTLSSDGAGTLIYNSPAAGNFSIQGATTGLSFTATGTPGFIGDGSGLTNLPSIPAGTPNTFAGFDGSGNLETITNWGITSEFGLALSTQVDLVNQNFNEFSVDVVPSAPSTGIYRNITEISSNLDPTNTGNMMGDNTGGGVTLLNFDLNHTGPGEVGQASVINGFSNLGDGTTSGHLNVFNGFNHGAHVANAYTVDQYNGVGVYPLFDLGSNLGSFNGISVSAQFNGATTGFSQTIGLFSSFGASSNTAHYHAIENGANGTAGAVVTDYLGVNTYLNNTTGDTFTGYNLNANTVSYNSYNGYQLNGSNVVVANDATGLNIDMGGMLTSATNATGLNLDMAGITSPNPVMGLQVNEGASNIFYTQNIANFTGSSPQISHLIGGTLQSTPGNPAANPFVFDILANTNVLIQDNVGPNPVFPQLGVAGFVAAGQIGVLSGITLDTYTEFGSARECPTFPGDGGTVSNYNFFLATGVLNAGGNLTIGNLYGLNIPSGFSTYATTSWGVHVSDITANNYFAKNVVIGGGTGLSTGGYNLDVTGTGNIDGDLTFVSETTPANPPSGSVTLFVDTADGHTKQIDSSGTVIDLTDGATGGVVSVNGHSGTVVLIPSDIAYTPTIPSDWVGTPTDEQTALDQLAATKAYGNNLSGSITLTDNTVSPTTLLSFPKALINNSIIQYSISRNGDFRTGTLYIANNNTVASLADNSTETADVGIDITATISGSNVLVQYTSTSTGFNASLKTITQQWQ